MGKSWFVTLLIDWYQSQNVKFNAIDMDNENNTLSRFFSKSEYVDVAKESDLDGVINRIVDGDIPVTVIDMRAASTDRIAPWWKQVDLDTLTNDYGVEFTAVGVVDTSFDSVANIGFWANDILASNQKMGYVIARNLARGESLGYDNSRERDEYKSTLGIVEVEIPKLDDGVHSQLETDGLRVAAALELNDQTHPLTKFMSRSRLKKYQQRVFAEFERIKARLLP